MHLNHDSFFFCAFAAPIVMKTILFACSPEPGHVLPTIPIAKRLLSYGHRIIYSTHPALDPILLSHAFITEPLMPQRQTTIIDGSEQSGWSFWYRFECAHMPMSRGQALAAILRSVIQRYNVDLIVADRLFAGAYHVPLRSVLGGVPCVLLSATLPDWDEEVESQGYPILVLCPEDFEVPCFRHRAPHVRYTEPSLYLREHVLGGMTHTSQIDKSNRIPILASFGTQSILALDLERRCALMADLANRRQDLHIVLVLGRSGSNGTLAHKWRDIANLTVCGEVVQWLELKHVALFVTHGGLGSVKEALYQGVPMVVVPVGFDQPFNAVRVSYHNLGNHLFPEMLSLDSLESVVDRTLESRQCMDSSHRFRDLVRRAEQQPTAAELIQTIIENGDASICRTP
jgi:UDP:flavonoid glycosyltransferase YjiC (YdhE family)